MHVCPEGSLLAAEAKNCPKPLPEPKPATKAKEAKGKEANLMKAWLKPKGAAANTARGEEVRSPS